jgi:ABC-type uncharacterized transport system permease subunit
VTPGALASSRRPLRGIASGSLSVVLTLAFGAIVLRALGASPLEAYRLIFAGAFGTPERLSYVLTAWAPLLLCTAGLLMTFRGGLWNIGVEGQVVLGAIAATGLLRGLGHALPPALALGLAAAGAAAGGAAWGTLAGALRTHGHVNEIFGGLGLNFVASSLSVYLVLGPWARPGIASTSGTLPFPPALWLPTVRISAVNVPGEVLLGLAGVALVQVVLSGTPFGLQLKAVGRSARAAYLRGVPNTRVTLAAFAACGALAGLAGFVLLTSTYSRHQLFPLISGGYGFLGILVVLLANFSAPATLPISLFFALISAGSLQLPLVMQLDSSVGGLIESLLVLLVLLLGGLQARLDRRR